MTLSLTPNVIPSIKCTLIARLSPCSPAWREGSFISWCWRGGCTPRSRSSGKWERWWRSVKWGGPGQAAVSFVEQWCGVLNEQWCGVVLNEQVVVVCAGESVIWSCKSHGLASHSISFLVIKCPFNLSVFKSRLAFTLHVLFVWKKPLFKVFHCYPFQHPGLLFQPAHDIWHLK